MLCCDSHLHLKVTAEVVPKPTFFPTAQHYFLPQKVSACGLQRLSERTQQYAFDCFTRSRSPPSLGRLDSLSFFLWIVVDQTVVTNTLDHSVVLHVSTWVFWNSFLYITILLPTSTTLDFYLQEWPSVYHKDKRTTGHKSALGSNTPTLQYILTVFRTTLFFSPSVLFILDSKSGLPWVMKTVRSPHRSQRAAATQALQYAVTVSPLSPRVQWQLCAWERLTLMPRLKGPNKTRPLNT